MTQQRKELDSHKKLYMNIYYNFIVMVRNWKQLQMSYSK